MDPSGKPFNEYENGNTIFSRVTGGVFTFANAVTYFNHSDHLGTPRVTTDYTGAVARVESNLPWGDNFSETGSLIDFMGWAAGDSDPENNADHFGAREYGKTQGRWLTPDPSGLAAVDMTNPQTWNRYAYVINNPLSFTDPLGLDYDVCGWDDATNTETCYWVYTGGGGGVPGPSNPSRGGGGGGRGRPIGNHPCYYALKNPCGTPANGNLFSCASGFASQISIAAGLQALGIGTSGVGGFITNALGGNAFSGATDLITSVATGQGGGHNVFYNLGQGVAAGPTQGFGAAFGNGIENTPWASGPVDVATVAIVNGAQQAITATTSSTLQTLNGTVEIGSVLGVAGELASGVGLLKLGYDAASYAAGLAGCAAGAIN